MITYAEALAYIYSLTNYEMKTGYRAAEHFDLRRMDTLAARTSHPQDRFRSIHIAGTKGKGSVCAMIESVLRAAGYRTGLYTSPHLHTFRERIRINGECIGEQRFTALIERLMPLAREIPELSTFEAATAVAFSAFADAGVDLAVLEVGLGGRLDATNIVRPLVSVITSISYDHTEVLGNTLAEIAGEKAGIIKPNVPVVSAPQPPEALAVIEEKCGQQNATLCLVGRDWSWEQERSSLSGQYFSLSARESPSATQLDHLFVPLLGAHQILNACVAVAALHLIQRDGIEIHPTELRRGLREVRWPGRLEILNRRPLLVVDGAHNGESCHRLAATLCQDSFRHRRLYLIFGALSGHDHTAMLSELLSLQPEIILTQADHPRAKDPSQLLDTVRDLGADAVVIPTTGEAIESVSNRVQPDDLICATGSLSIVAAVRETWLTHSGQELPRDPITS